MEKKTSFFFILILFLVLINEYLYENILNIDYLFYDFYLDKIPHNDIETLLENKKNFFWLSYVIVIFSFLIRCLLVSLCLSICMFFYDMENKIKFNLFFKIALLSEFVLILVGFVKLLYFLFIKTNYTLQDIQQFYPLSYTNFLDLNTIEPWLIYPLQTINLFEIGYFFVLVYGLHKLLKNKYWKSFEIVAVSYGTGLTIWLGLVMFLTISIT